MRADRDNHPAENETKYQRIVRELEADITAGKFAPLDPIPSERALMRRFGVARQTVRQAIRALQVRGFVRTRHGRGTFVVGYALQRRKIGLVAAASAMSGRLQRLGHELGAFAARWNLELVAEPLAAEDPAQLFAAAKELAARLAAEPAAGVLFKPIAFPRDAARLNREIVATLHVAHVPVVLLGCDLCPPPARSEFDVLAIDEFSAGKAIAAHLRSGGARKVRFLLPAGEDADVRARLSGCCDELGVVAATTGVVVEAIEPIAVSSVLFSDPDIDALVCRNDAEALACAASVRRLGLRVPEDVQIVGFDDGTAAELKAKDRPTTVAPSYADLARLAVDRLRSLAADPTLPGCRLTIHAPLVPGATTRAGQGHL